MGIRMDGRSRALPRRLTGARHHARRLAIGVLGCVMFATSAAISGVAPATAASTGQRIDLKVLVLSDGNPTEEAIVSELVAENIPFTRVDLNNPSRPTITASFLSGTAPTGPHAYYQAVVLPNDSPAQLSPAEMAALVSFETTFGIRQVDSFTWPTAALGLNTVTGTGATGGYAGSLDGKIAKVTPAGKTQAFPYLVGNVPFEDISTSVGESYAYVAIPLANTPTRTFTTLVDAPIPNSTRRGSILGVVKNGTREELVSTVAINQYQQQFQAIAHGIITWMTKGVHLGYDRNYFTVHVDDVLLPDSRWSTTGNCTPGDDCPPGSTITTRDIRMKQADVLAAVAWSNTTGFRLDFAYNAFGTVEFAAANRGQDPLKNSLLANKSRFNWINHTYDHDWLGCIQNFAVAPWQCATSGGATQWYSQANIQSQITQNIAWAQANGVSINPTELVTGEHSGLAALPQQPTDNPFFGPALTATGIQVIASDNSRESEPRQVGSATTLPRYPMSVFYNTATKVEAADLYNWIYTSAANGGSGICESNPASTCIAPLNVNTGYASYIVPTEARIDMVHIMGNDPRPHYAHQSNLAEERILYLPLNAIINNYRSLFATNTPIAQPTYTESSQLLNRKNAFAAALAGPSGVGELATGLTGYVLDGKVFVQSTSSREVPVTAPTGARLTSSTGPVFGSAYAGERSAWVTVGPTSPLVIQLAGGVY